MKHGDRQRKRSQHALRQDAETHRGAQEEEPLSRTLGRAHVAEDPKEEEKGEEHVEHRVAGILEEVLSPEKNDRGNPRLERRGAQPSREQVERGDAQGARERRPEDRRRLADSKREKGQRHQPEKERWVVGARNSGEVGRHPVAVPDHLLRLLRVVAVVEVGEVNVPELCEDNPRRDQEEEQRDDRPAQRTVTFRILSPGIIRSTTAMPDVTFPNTV